MTNLSPTSTEPGRPGAGPPGGGGPEQTPHSCPGDAEEKHPKEQVNLYVQEDKTGGQERARVD